MAGPISSPQFIGREQELAVLEEVLSRAAGGQGAFALLAGESGIGKSRLTAELGERARSSGMTVVVGECLELAEGELPYAPLIGALRALLRDLGGDGAGAGVAREQLERLLPELAADESLRAGPAAGGGAEQGRMFEQLLGAILEVARERPLLLVIEDLHWADRSTRDFLGFLIRNARREPLALLLTYRSDELHRRHPVRPFIAELERVGGAVRVDLRPFDHDELALQVEAIIGDSPPSGLVAELLERSDGNPFFAEELLAMRSGGTALAGSLRDALLLRVEALPEVSRTLLQVAAIAGRTVEHHLLETVAGLDEDGLNEGLRAAVANHLLLHDSDTMGYSFRHALLREAVYDDLLPGERRALHIGVARALTAQPGLAGGKAAAAAELAHHWYAAHELGEALRASLAAAIAAEDAHALAEASVHYGRALEIWDSVADRDLLELPLEQSEVIRRAGEAEHFAGEPGRAIGFAEQSLALLDEHENPVAAALAHERLGRYIWQAGRDRDALPEYRRAVELMPAEPPSEERALVLAAEGQVLMLCSQIAGAEVRCEEAIAIAAVVGAPAVEAHALNTMIVVHSERGEFEQSAAAAERARAIARELVDVAEIGRSYVNGSDALDQAGRVAEAVAVAKEGVEEVRSLGADRGFGDFLRGEIANRLLRLGRWDEAGELLQELLGRSPSGFNEAMCRNLLGQLRAEEGEHDEAAAHSERAREVLMGAADSQWLGVLAQGLATNALWSGDPRRALELVTECLASLGERGRLFSTARLYELGARACADLTLYRGGEDGDSERLLDQARELLARFEVAIAAAGVPIPIVEAARAGCIAEISRITNEDPIGAWSAAQERWELLGDRYLAAYARWHRAEASLAAGERGAAQELLREALATAADLKARPLLKELEAFALRGRLESAEGAGESETDRALRRLDLTARELEVLALLAAGQTNREIAAELVISDKTASVHVSNILGKLGVRNRVEAASVAHTLGF